MGLSVGLSVWLRVRSAAGCRTAAVISEVRRGRCREGPGGDVAQEAPWLRLRRGSGDTAWLGCAPWLGGNGGGGDRGDEDTAEDAGGEADR